MGRNNNNGEESMYEENFELELKQRLAEEITILRIEGTLFCFDPREARRRDGMRAGSVCLNRFSGLIGGAPAGFRLPQSATAGRSRLGPVSAGQGSNGACAHCRRSGTGRSRRGPR